MSITPEPTPNPRAMKFTVGAPVGGPVTHTTSDTAPSEIGEILGLTGVTSVFMTADFVTVSGDDSIDWDQAAPLVVDALTRLFD